MPTERKRLLGNPGRRPLPEPAVILPAATEPPPPPISGLLPATQQRWHAMWEVGLRWLSPDADAPMLVEVAHLMDECERMRAEIEKDGRLLEEPIVTPTGHVVGIRRVPNPTVKMLREAERQLERYLMQLGFAPIARARLGLVEVRRQSKLEELLAKRSTAATPVASRPAPKRRTKAAN
jgi:hypothetical protein